MTLFIFVIKFCYCTIVKVSNIYIIQILQNIVTILIRIITVLLNAEIAV